MGLGEDAGMGTARCELQTLFSQAVDIVPRRPLFQIKARNSRITLFLLSRPLPRAAEVRAGHSIRMNNKTVLRSRLPLSQFLAFCFQRPG